MMDNGGKANSVYNRIFKRIFDIFFSFAFILVFLPILFLSTFINCFFTKFHPIFIQKRVGRREKSFHIIKLRTLKLDAPAYEEKCKDVDYTKIGFFQLKYRL